MTRDSKYFLREATEQELLAIRRQHHAHWAGGLTIEQYLGREVHLASQPLTANGGITCWVLASHNNPGQVLASCESIKKEAIVQHPGQRDVKTVVSHGIGSVFTPVANRGKGYAKVMILLLGEILRNHQAPPTENDDEPGSPFNVLYSDIGKQFYTKLGWLPYHSSHISLPPHITQYDSPTSAQPAPPKGLRWLYSTDLPSLCDLDTTMLKESFKNNPLPSSQDGTLARVAFLPTYEVIQWHHAREEYVGKHLRGKSPEIKGAITSDGQKWSIWTRTFAPNDAKLTILRLSDWGSDGGHHNGNGNGARNGNGNAHTDDSNNNEDLEQIKLLLQAARIDASTWGLTEVIAWNPSPRILSAAKMVLGKEVPVVHREDDSICSLRWNTTCGEGEGKGDANGGRWEPEGKRVIWEANYKIAWC